MVRADKGAGSHAQSPIRRPVSAAASAAGRQAGRTGGGDRHDHDALQTQVSIWCLLATAIGWVPQWASVVSAGEPAPSAPSGTVPQSEPPGGKLQCAAPSRNAPPLFRAASARGDVRSFNVPGS